MLLRGQILYSFSLWCVCICKIFVPYLIGYIDNDEAQIESIGAALFVDGFLFQKYVISLKLNLLVLNKRECCY